MEESVYSKLHVNLHPYNGSSIRLLVFSREDDELDSVVERNALTSTKPLPLVGFALSEKVSSCYVSCFTRLDRVGVVFNRHPLPDQCFSAPRTRPDTGDGELGGGWN